MFIWNFEWLNNVTVFQYWFKQINKNGNMAFQYGKDSFRNQSLVSTLIISQYLY